MYGCKLVCADAALAAVLFTLDIVTEPAGVMLWLWLPKEESLVNVWSWLPPLAVVLLSLTVLKFPGPAE